MRSHSFLALCLAVVGLSAGPAGEDLVARSGEDGRPGEPVPATAPAVADTPFSFEENVGQTDESVRYLARGRGYALFLSDNEAVLALRGEERSELLRMRVVDGEPREISGVQALAGRSNYFIGNNPEGWHTNVSHFGKVRYEAIYPGIDLVYYGRQGELEYDFVVAPGADPGVIRLAFDGARSIAIDESGGLTVEMADGQVFQHAPVIYQEGPDGRETVAGGYVLHEGREVSFDIGRYDPDRALVIDPVIFWASYFGGSGLDVVHHMRVDATGHVYLAGRTLSVNLPTTAGAFDELVNNPGEDAFVAKFSPDGTSLVYATYIGGTSGNYSIFQLGDSAFALDVDAAGSAYITGESHSTNFPITPGAWDTTYNGGLSDVYVTKLSPDGASLVYSTWVGGPGQDIGTYVEVDDLGQAHVAVRNATHTGAFPTTTGAFDTTANGDWDAAVFKLSADGSTLMWSTLLGGSSGDHTGRLDIDAAGNVVVAGITSSFNFPTTVGAFDTSYGGVQDDFVSKLSADGSTLLFSGFLGGSAVEWVGAPAVDAAGNIYVLGYTASSNFPITPDALQTVHGGGPWDVTLTRLSPDGSTIQYSTFLGGSDSDSAAGPVIFDSDGNIWFAGGTSSPNFPTTPGAHPHQGLSDAFVVQLDPTATALLVSTHVGASGGESATLGLDASGQVYLGGSTSSLDFPVTPGAPQPSFGGGPNDGFAMKLDPAAVVDLVLTKTAAPEPVAPGGTLTYTLDVTNDGDAPASHVELTDTLPASVTFVSASDPSCAHVAGVVTCDLGDLAPGAGAVVTVDVTPNVEGLITNAASVASAEADAAPADNEASVDTTVLLVNAPPEAVDDAINTPENTPVTVDVLANDSDPDGDPLTVTSVSGAVNGGAAINVDETITYTPNPGFHGIEVLSYTVSDGHGGIDTALLTITVDAVNEAPVAVDDTATATAGVPEVIDVLANDTDGDGDALSVAGVTQGTLGTVTTDGAVVTYTATSPLGSLRAAIEGLPGLNRGQLNSLLAKVRAAEGSFARGNARAAANQLEALVHELNAMVRSGRLDPALASPIVALASQLAAGGSTLTDTFTYTADDGHGGTDTATVTVDVNL